MKKIPIILTAGLLLGGLSLPAAALGDITSGVANQVIEPALVFTATDTSANQISFTFDGTEQGIKLTKLLIASYKYALFSRRMVTERLDELGTEVTPSWSSVVRDLSSQLTKNSPTQNKTITLDNYSSFFGNAPGAFFYAAQIETKENETYWVRGMIDYRLCAYTASHSPHNVKACQGRIDEETQKYVFERSQGVVRDPSDKFVEWGDELYDIVKSNLDSIKSSVYNWMNSASKKEELLASLNTYRGLADDVNRQDEILGIIDAYETILNARTLRNTAEADLNTLGSELDSWDGSPERRNEFLAQIEQIRDNLSKITDMRTTLEGEGYLSNTTVDNNTNIDNLWGRLSQYEQLLQEKADTYDEEHPQEPNPDNTGSKDNPDDPDQTGSDSGAGSVGNQGTDTPGASGSTGSGTNAATGTGSTNTSSDSNSAQLADGGMGGVDDETLDFGDGEADEDIPAMPETTNSGTVNAVTIPGSSASEEMVAAEPDNTTTEETSVDDLITDVNIPVLSEELRISQDDNWGIGVFICVILGIAGVLSGAWWLKLLFARRKSSEN